MKDLLALIVLLWLRALDKSFKIGIYCSDIAGAFDRVSVDKLCSKCFHKDIWGRSFRFLESYLAPREAVVLVGGANSKPMSLVDTVFQGVVLGPPLWNTFFSDVADEVRALDFQEIVFADA